MKYENLIYVAAALSLVWLLNPQETHAAKKRNLTINFENNAEHCSDLRVKSDGEVAQKAEMFSLGRGDASMIELQDTTGRSVIRVRAWDRAEYSVEACKVAVADDRATAEGLALGISVTHTAGHFYTSGPVNSDNGNWQLYLIIHSPRDGKLDLETKNGPIDVAGIAGTLKLRASNGPIAVRDCGGVVDVNTQNGPIALSGGSGEVHLTAHNGPIALELAGEVWNGPRLEARTVNGPVSLVMPDGYRTGVRLEAASHAPISCASVACQNAFAGGGDSNLRTLQMNGSSDTIRISTGNGPVAISAPGKGRRVL
jgi:hypothetical protein